MTHAQAPKLTAKTLTRFAFTLLACSLVHAPLAAVAQTPQVAPPAAAQPAETVRLSVIFTDKSGRTATDVRPEDVRVSENGEQQTLTRVAPEELPVTFALLVDNSRSLTACAEAATFAPARGRAIRVRTSRR